MCMVRKSYCTNHSSSALMYVEASTTSAKTQSSFQGAQMPLEATIAADIPFSISRMQVHAAWLADTANISGYEQTGCTQSMFANRLSWTYDFRGPSKSVDTGELGQQAEKA